MLFFYAHYLKNKKVKYHLFSPPSLMLSLKTKTNPYLYEPFKCLLYYSINLLSVETI